MKNKILTITSDLQALYKGNRNTQLVVLGHQKAGTTALGGLVATACDLSFENDPIFHINRKSKKVMLELLTNKELFISKAPSRRKFLFKNIVKDPDYIFALDTVFELYPQSKFVFIARHPADIIRSIFNRLKLDGRFRKNTIKPNDVYKYTELWGCVLNGIETDDCESVVERLAHRIELSTNEYLANKNKIHCVKYEDFLVNKEAYILDLIERLGLKAKKTIAAIVDKEFQPKGNSKIHAKEFFGEERYSQIMQICKNTAAEFNYK